MSYMAVDPAAGGKDKSTIAMRYDGWFAKIVEKPGVETPMGTEIAGLVVILAAMRVDAMLEGDLDGYAVWKRLLWAIDELGNTTFDL